MKRPKRHLFTNEEDLYIMRQRALGTSYNHIADALERSRNAIIGRWHGVLKKDVETANAAK